MSGPAAPAWRLYTACVAAVTIRHCLQPATVPGQRQSCAVAGTQVVAGRDARASAPPATLSQPDWPLSAGTVVFVRLLGPFSATVGQPTTLCWRLERGGQPDQQLPASRISFEVQAEVRGQWYGRSSTPSIQKGCHSLAV